MLMTTAYFLTADLSYAPLPAVADVPAMEREATEILDRQANAARS